VQVPNTANVDVMDNFFSPSTLTVSAGTAITWTSRGGNVHTVTGAPCSPISFGSDSQFPSGFRNGEKFNFSVPADAKPGTMIFYFCRFHGAPGSCVSIGPGMAGVIIVK
jgi:plastocyanin